MSNIQIITDSASDMTQEDAKRWGIRVLPFLIRLDGKEYRTGVDISASEFYEKLRESREIPSTSQITPDELYRIFLEYIEQGKQILYISISSHATGTFNNAQIAKDMILEEKPDAVIELVDSMRFTYIYALAAIRAAEMAEQGRDIAEIRRETEDFMDRYDIYIIAQSLRYLEKGGRINKASLVMGNVLDIRPLLSIRNGLIEAIGSIRGSKKIVAKLFQKLCENGYDQKDKTMLIVQGDMPAEAEEMKRLLEEHFAPREVLIREVGPTIATHIGPVLGVFFAIR